MKLYLITLVNDDLKGYDCYWGHVIAADRPLKARHIASLQAADEGPDCWLDATKTNIFKITDETSRKEGIVLSDFNAG